jgi:hypothetical protein
MHQRALEEAKDAAIRRGPVSRDDADRADSDAIYRGWNDRLSYK